MYSSEEAALSGYEIVEAFLPGYGYSAYLAMLDANVWLSEFMIPVLLKYNYEFGLFSVAGLFGPFFTIPAGKAEYKETLMYAPGMEEFESVFDVEDAFGLMAGLNFGVKLGPGTLFFDLRYAIDSDMIKVDGERFVHRNFLPISIGYELGLLPKKR
jgi:hypothetical protein